ncbi:MAG: protein-glutamate O-methyltransferase CheR [Gammaproteobacteria bacterium]|nr:protein-glutamate O-methyltransferase CheR [Gammaproteobacteria bacterium]
MEQEREFKFTREDFDYLRKIVTESTGIIANEDKYTMYYSRLARRVRKLGLSDFTEYRQYLRNNSDTELMELVNSVTTNLTSFFRENHHFEFLKNTFVPSLKQRGERKIRIWSAGCSTGEEPYSIAMSLAQAIPDHASWDIKILATDLDSNVISKAASGIYGQERVEGIDPLLLRSYFKRGKATNEGFVKVNPELMRMIEFKQLNLLHSWPIGYKMDCIFCRNVVIYFDKETKNQLVERYAEQMIDNGYLFMGHSESLFKSTDRFKLLGQTIYQKTR